MSNRRTVVAVIDDDPHFLDAMDHLLSAYGYDTELHPSAEAFLETAPESKAICLIVDVQLGGSSGIELGRQLAKSGFKFPIIFMTGSGDEHIERRAMETGCVAFLRKPFSAVVLIEALNRSTQ